MPILNFTDLKANLQSYDFDHIALCRLAAIYIAFRNLLETQLEQATSQDAQAGLEFIRFFDELLISLDELRIYHSQLRTNNGTKLDYIRTIIDIEHKLNQMYGNVINLLESFNIYTSPDEFRSLNSYLISFVNDDLQEFKAIVQKERVSIDELTQSYFDHDNEKLSNYVALVDHRNAHQLLQLYDFLNLYHVTGIKPASSLLISAKETVRETTRLTANLLGSTISVGSGLFSYFAGVAADSTLTSTAKAAEDWLKQWNDKYTPPDLSKPRPLME